MTSAAAAAILDGMPDPRDLRRDEQGGMEWISAGPVVLACYPSGDVGLRNVAAVTMRQLGFPGKTVAAVFGLTEGYVATLRQRALRDGAAGLVRPSGPKPKLTPADWERGRRWRRAGTGVTEIAALLGVAPSTVSRHLGGSGQQELPRDKGSEQEPEHAAGPSPRPAPGARGGRAEEPAGPGEPPPAASGTGLVLTGPRIRAGRLESRHAGAMLLHAFGSQASSGAILAACGDGESRGRYEDVALLAAASLGFALGAATIEQFKHLTAQAAGPLAGLAVLPGLRTLRPRLAAIADRTDPLELQSLFAAAMLGADPVLSGVYYVDDHFVAYTGAKPVGKGWNNKRGKAEKGRADTHVTAHDGRAVCFVTGEPSGLVTTLPLALAELKKAAPPGQKIMVGFDRGGAYAQVFRACREQQAQWLTYRRAPLAVPENLPVLAEITVNGKARQVAWADETARIKEYGQARQLTLFENGRPALQVLTSDKDGCAAEILSFLKSRWREENFLKYGAQNYGIDKICDYAAAIEANAKVIDNPARKAANTAVRAAEKHLAAAREAYAIMLADPAIPARDKNARLIPAAQRKITRAEARLAAAKAARDQTPAKLPASQIDPGARIAILRSGRRGLQMVLRLLAHNAEHWLASHLNAYLRDDDEYRAITRETIIRGLSGVITYTPTAVTVILGSPRSPRIAAALTLLINEINAAPPAMPGDSRPITYQLAAQA